MAAREAKDYTKAFPVPKLDFSGELDPERCLLRSEIGKQRALERRQKTISSLETHPPTSVETSEIHEMFVKTRNKIVREEKDFMPISSTLKSKSILMHPQQKNIHGKIFGGYLMREAAELSWLCAHMFTKGDSLEYEGIIICKKFI
jgi:acyl-coenzyme A thioesterase 9